MDISLILTICQYFHRRNDILSILSRRRCTCYYAMCMEEHRNRRNTIPVTSLVHIYIWGRSRSRSRRRICRRLLLVWLILFLLFLLRDSDISDFDFGLGGLKKFGDFRSVKILPQFLMHHRFLLVQLQSIENPRPPCWRGCLFHFDPSWIGMIRCYYLQVQ